MLNDLKKAELVEVAKELKLDPKGLKKDELIALIETRMVDEVPEGEVVIDEPEEVVVESKVTTTDSLYEPMYTDDREGEVSFRQDFVGYIGGKWYRVPKGVLIKLPKDVEDRFRKAGKLNG